MHSLCIDLFLVFFTIKVTSNVPTLNEILPQIDLKQDSTLLTVYSCSYHLFIMLITLGWLCFGSGKVYLGTAKYRYTVSAIVTEHNVIKDSSMKNQYNIIVLNYANQ